MASIIFTPETRKKLNAALRKMNTPHTQRQGQATPEGATKGLEESQSNEVKPSIGYIGHTPGPWKVAGGEVWSANSRRVAATGGKFAPFNQNEQRANARLIAAAPELLEALQSVERVLSTYSDKIESWQWHMLKSVRSAVAKAEAK